MSAARPLRLVPPAPDRDAVEEPQLLLWRSVLVWACVLVDFLAITVAVSGVLLLHPGGPSARLELIAAAAVPVWLLAMSLGRAHEARFLAVGSEEYKRVFDTAARLVAITALVSYGFPPAIARPLVVLALPIAAGLDLLGRYGVRKVVHRLRRNGRCAHRLLLVG